MESIETCHDTVQKALQLTVDHWEDLSEKHDWLVPAVEALYNTPLLQHLYVHTAGSGTRELRYDLRSAAALCAARVLREEEMRFFNELGLFSHLQCGIMLAARILRERLSAIEEGALISTTRNMIFTYTLKLVGEEMRDPRDTFRKIIEQLDMDQMSKEDLFMRSIMNTRDRSMQLVLH